MHEAGYPFAAIALDSGGVNILEPAKWTRRVTAQLTGAPAPVNVEYQHARWRLVQVIDALFTGQAAGTLHTPLERAQHPVHVAALVPYDRRDKRFEDLAADLSRWLSHVYGVASPTIAQGPGVDISGVRPDRRGDLYFQVSALYGVPYRVPVEAPPTQPRVRASAPPPVEASVREEPRLRRLKRLSLPRRPLQPCQRGRSPLSPRRRWALSQKKVMNPTSLPRRRRAARASTRSFCSKISLASTISSPSRK